MGFDLTNERIQDTYEQLVQISGSKLVDGTGSLITPDITTVSASYAVTASYALNGGGGEWDEITGKPSGLVSSSAQTIANLPSGTISGSSQVDYDSISNVPSGLLSSSAQIADDISGSFTSTSASIASDVATNKSDISTLTAATSSYLTEVPSGTVSSSAQTIANIAGGTIAPSTINVDTANIQSASIGYLQSITGSAKIIGDAYIILNNDTPTQRYAGLVVQDSGSTNNTASLEFDGQTNDWFYEYTDDGGVTTEFGTVMFGPGYNTKGSHVYPSNNTILKGTGDHHMVDSSITDDGSTIDMTGASLLKAPSNMVGGGAPSVGGNRRFVFANGSSTSADDSVILGGESNDISTSYVGMFGTSGTNINGGDLSVVVGGYQHTISGGARNVTIGGQGVTNNQDYAIVLGRTTFTTPSPYTTYTANLDVSGSAVISGSTTINGTLAIEGISNVSESIASASAGGGAAGLVAGTGVQSMRSSDDLTTVAADASGDFSIAMGYDATATGERAIAIGIITEAFGYNSIAIGEDAAATSAHAIAIGDAVAQSQEGTIAIGRSALAQGTGGLEAAVAIGKLASATNTGVALGYQSYAKNNAVGLGSNSLGNGNNAVAIGNSATVSANDGIAIGTSTSVTLANGINIGDTFKYDGSTTATIEDSLTVNGQINSPVHITGITSNTASVDFDNGNFTTISAGVGATYLANPTNLKSGTTYTLIITNGANISGYGTAWKFAGGTEPTLSTGTDILTCVSDGTNLYATALADFS